MSTYLLCDSNKFRDVSQIALSFNGGKDCTVILHLLSQVKGVDLQAFRFVHFVQPDEFPEVVKFRQDVEAHFGIKI